MEIGIIANKCVPFHGGTLEERPMGGTESAVIRLAESLHARGNKVTVYTPMENPPPSKPDYLPLAAAHLAKGFDVLISVRDWIPLLVGIPAKKRMFWTGDAFDQIQNFGIGDRRVIGRIDTLLAVSVWHATTLCGQSGFPIEKTWVIRNGVHLPYFEGGEARQKKRLVYTSTPYRGLALLPELFPRIRSRHPEAELHVFSGMEVYGGPEGFDSRARADFETLRERLGKVQGCFLHGNVPQKQLARQLMKSAVLCYPNTFLETSCISVMEAAAAGCVAVTSALAALKETVGDAGILVPGKPGSAEYAQAFIDACDKVLTDEGLWMKLSEAGKQRARQIYDWKVVAERFEEFAKKHARSLAWIAHAIQAMGVQASAYPVSRPRSA